MASWEHSVNALAGRSLSVDTPSVKLPSHVPTQFSPFREIVLRRAFRKYDKDDSGFLSRDEIISIAASEEAGLKLPAEKISEMLLSLVTDADQKVCNEKRQSLNKDCFHYSVD